MNQETEKFKNDILHEIGEIEKVLENINNLNREISHSDINTNNKTAMAAYLMNFYNGIENILKRAAKDYYETVPTGETWHKDLLTLSSIGTKDKIPILTKDLVDKLYDYLGFRHFFIHGYSFMLEWGNLKSLIENINSIWEEIKLQIKEFINKL